MNKTVTYNGTFTEMRWTNPHVSMKFMVANPDGSQTTFTVEAHPPAVMAREGFRPKQYAPGEKITVLANPSRKGMNTLSLLAITDKDGKTMRTNPSN